MLRKIEFAAIKFYFWHLTTWHRARARMTASASNASMPVPEQEPERVPAVHLVSEKTVICDSFS